MPPLPTAIKNDPIAAVDLRFRHDRKIDLTFICIIFNLHIDLSKTYIAGKNDGMAPIATVALPNTYTNDKYRIVLYFPRKLSDKIAPKIHME